ncbi:MAG: beta-ketoacyl-[acyl-carrier-protein] synthase II [Flavobacteriales bacterium]|jgi:3-oxoacyl-[acyl-carrier-protein] synthase II|nr:beta-ketoacyl-[acyl-carrier-protein] synthase II [Flavobacteriales bacterium]|tara:strand:+ start:2411 stop:3664 length:1254 start_codon:yes stop_codon:yes gene_type:complete
MELNRVVITGLGSLTPIGNNITEYWNGLVAGKSGANAITHFNAEKFKTQFACEIKNFDPNKYFDRKELRKYDDYTMYGMVAAEEAINDSQINLTTVDKNQVGVIWGSGIGGIKTFSHEVSEFVKGDGTPRFNPFFIPKMIADIAAGIMSIKYGFKGPNFATVSACASSSHSIIDAFNYIRLGKANIFLCGGSEASIHEAGVGGFNALKALSTNNNNPTQASRPFDIDRDGFVLGEGAGALILENYNHAIKRNAKIYAEVIGAGMSADAHHITAPHPEGQGALLVMQNALKDAKIHSKYIDYINVHGTSTPLGDISEMKAIQNIFKENIYDLNISSTKSMTGHLLGAAGAVESIACILSLCRDIIPPTINLENLDPQLDSKINYTAKIAQKRKINYALCNTFGFGGHNASIIFKSYKN